MTVKEAIRDAWSDAETADQACHNLKRMMEADKTLYRAVMQPHVDGVVRSIIGEEKRQERRKIWSKTMKDWSRPVQPDERASVLAQINSMSIMDMRLRSGKRLADAMKAEVVSEKEYYAHMSDHMGDKARFFGIIADKMKDGKTVSQVFKPNDLEALRDAA
jgi:hypothetical protein